MCDLSFGIESRQFALYMLLRISDGRGAGSFVGFSHCDSAYALTCSGMLPYLVDEEGLRLCPEQTSLGRLWQMHVRQSAIISLSLSLSMYAVFLISPPVLWQ